MKVDRPLIECLVRIRNMPEFAAFKTHIDNELAAHQTALVTLNEDRALHVAQGMARAMAALKNLIDTAPALLSKERQ